ncbi:CoA ester lyase [Streptomyces sp. NBC_01476]|uniref:HpcH/HpaI aldolase/citrate lyase family protein n=1 Tax=Streptomyces sp. NBC_01476 TaxID=2903881 RepID=UPI002E3520AA|nr:CoA ester lyase [Streptomyces sp. NBC_01476]
MTEPRPRRSVLYMPGANERALEKARTLPTDALILDLEDSVAPDAKAGARKRVAAAAASGEYGPREVTIRVNAPGTPWHTEDLKAAAEAGPDAVVVPKVDSADTVRRIVAALEAGGAPDRTAVWAMIETPEAVFEARAIAAASERLTVLVLGTNDLVKELRAEHVPGRAPLLTALSLVLLAARVTGKTVLDGVYNDVQDLAGFEAETLQSRQLGFDGKTLIHPKQLEPCNRIFTPTDAEVDRSRRIIAAFEEATSQGRGVVTVDGRMIENLHVDEARRVLAVVEAVRDR